MIFYVGDIKFLSKFSFVEGFSKFYLFRLGEEVFCEFKRNNIYV